MLPAGRTRNRRTTAKHILVRMNLTSCLFTTKTGDGTPTRNRSEPVQERCLWRLLNRDSQPVCVLPVSWSLRPVARGESPTKTTVASSLCTDSRNRRPSEFILEKAECWRVPSLPREASMSAPSCRRRSKSQRRSSAPSHSDRCWFHSPCLTQEQRACSA